MATKKTMTIAVVEKSIAIQYTYNGVAKQFEYYPICSVKGIVSTPAEDIALRDSGTNQRKSDYHHDSVFEIGLYLEGTKNILKFDIQDVTNQPTWLPTPAGLAVAISDINLWIAECGCCTASEASLVNIEGILSDIDVEIALLSQIEDTPHVSGDSGIQMLAVRNEAQSDLTTTEGDYSPVSVDAKGNIIVGSGENHIGSIGGNTGRVAFSQTTTAGAYAAGDCVGGLIDLSGATRLAGGTGILKSVLIADKDDIKANLEILIFSQDPSLSTITDDAPFVLNASDIGKVIRRISVSSSDYVTLGGVAFVDINSIAGDIQTNASTSLYAAIILPAGSTPTYTSTNALTGYFGFLQD